jgi:hypothetical protein
MMMEAADDGSPGVVSDAFGDNNRIDDATCRPDNDITNLQQQRQQQ